MKHEQVEVAKHPFCEPWEDSDLIFVVEEEKFHVHRQIMSLHSPVFKAMLNSVGFKEVTATEIPLPGKKANEFLDFLELLYMKKIDEVQCKWDKSVAYEIIFSFWVYVLSSCKNVEFEVEHSGQ